MSETETITGFRAPEPEELAPLFGGYRIEYLIATGGMGAVYKAVQISLDRDVAIKILPLEFGSDPEFCQNFTAEAKAMAKLNHPNLIGVYDFGEVNGMLFIVMEYVPGQSLYDAFNGKAVDPAEVIRVMSAISLGLAHAHDHGILHRDIKPANILLNQHMEPKIGDFGLARSMDLQIREGEAIYGTPGYTAPEVMEPPHTVDQRTDIFSLGVMVHELLTGMLPDHDRRPTSAIAKCDPRFDQVVQKATHPRREQRFQSAAQLAEELQKIANTAGPRVVLQTGASAAGMGSRALGVTARVTLPSTTARVPLSVATSKVSLRAPGRPASPAAIAAPAVGRSIARPAARHVMHHRPSLASSNKSGGGMMIFLILVVLAVVIGYLFRDQILGSGSPPPPPSGPQPLEPATPLPPLPGLPNP